MCPYFNNLDRYRMRQKKLYTLVHLILGENTIRPWVKSLWRVSVTNLEIADSENQPDWRLWSSHFRGFKILMFFKITNPTHVLCGFRAVAQPKILTNQASTVKKSPCKYIYISNGQCHWDNWRYVGGSSYPKMSGIRLECNSCLKTLKNTIFNTLNVKCR